MPAYRGEHEDILLPFVDAMRYKLAANRHKGKKWDDNTIEGLFEKAMAELEELREAIASGNRTEIQLEAADVGNFVMFIAAKAIQQAAAGAGTDDHAFGVEPRSVRLSREMEMPTVPGSVFSIAPDPDHQNYRTQGTWQPTDRSEDGRIDMWIHKVDGYIVYADHRFTREKQLPVAPWTIKAE